MLSHAVGKSYIGIVSIISYSGVAEPVQLFTLMEEALYLLHVYISTSAMNYLSKLDFTKMRSNQKIETKVCLVLY